MPKPCAHLICCTTASQVHCGKPVRNCFDWKHNLRNGFTKSCGGLRAQGKKTVATMRTPKSFQGLRLMVFLQATGGSLSILQSSLSLVQFLQTDLKLGRINFSALMNSCVLNGNGGGHR